MCLVIVGCVGKRNQNGGQSEGSQLGQTGSADRAIAKSAALY
jgi:hypothetical protein